MSQRQLHVKLNEADFATLVGGGEVAGVSNGTTVRLILADIGFDRMKAAIDAAILKSRDDALKEDGLA